MWSVLAYSWLYRSMVIASILYSDGKHISDKMLVFRLYTLGAMSGLLDSSGQIPIHLGMLFLCIQSQAARASTAVLALAHFSTLAINSSL